MDYAEQLRLFLDIVITCVLVGFIGIEREDADRPAGIRTNMIVGGASCLFVTVLPSILFYVEGAAFADKLTPDPIRVLEAIVVGVGFIGAGTIMKPDGETRVKGLTTAATLLFSAGIGVTVAVRLYILAVCITILMLLINRGIDRFFSRYTSIKHKSDKE